MKLCIPIEHRPEGGLYTFVGYFRAFLDRHRIAHTADLEADSDFLFVNSWVVPHATVLAAKRVNPSLRIVHRVDGAAQDYGRGGNADWQQARVNLLADVTVFQSQYARFATREKFHVVAQDGPVIYNPVELATFSPNGPHAVWATPTDRPRVANVAFSTNIRKGSWRLNSLAATHPEVEFVLCGRYEGIEPRANIRLEGHLDHDALARVLRSCDVFLDLTENEACPNVIIEALASGLPILHNNSGAVPELVGDCGVPFEQETFGHCLKDLLDRRAGLGTGARARAASLFDPETVFPRYLDAMRDAARRPLPRRREVFELARDGYPVMPRPLGSVRAWAGSVYRRTSRPVRKIVDTLRTNDRPDFSQRLARHTIGWVTYDSFGGRKRSFAELDSFTRMRVGNVAAWINHHDIDLRNELYDPRARYDIVVFQKTMDPGCQTEVARIHGYGGRVVFDANVNYYEVAGDYIVPGTRPTADQQRDAIRMTTAADWVVADSTYLLSIIHALNPRVTWIPDNVDPTIYCGVREHRSGSPLRLVWSGIAKKAAHLLELCEVFAALRNVELTLVADERPDCVDALEAVVPCRVVTFTEHRYARTLLDNDVIVSPKRLVNAYELAHTEYKITLGMAVGLPAVASPQQSYVEAINHRGGGIIAETPADWIDAIERLRDPAVRADLGRRARQTVAERYSTPVVAEQYRSLLYQLVRTHVDSAPAVS